MPVRYSSSPHPNAPRMAATVPDSLDAAGGATVASLGNAMTSYAWESDRSQPPFVAATIAALEQEHIKVWHDKKSLSDSDRYNEKIRAAILACDVMVVCVTPRYHLSVIEGRGCAMEVDLALSRQKENFAVVVVCDDAAMVDGRSDKVEKLKAASLWVPDGDVPRAVAAVGSVGMEIRNMYE